MAVSIQIDTSATVKGLRVLSSGITKQEEAALSEAGRVVQTTARKMCPQSPTKSQSEAYDGPSASRFHRGRSPGTLTRSIKVEKGRDYVDVGVFSGDALRYANFIHNRRYRDWEFLGPGSEAKDEGGRIRVGEQFLPRAARYHQDNGDFDKIFGKPLRRAITKWNR